MITMVVSAAALLACIGLAIDVGYLQLVKTRMQSAADAAALGGIQEFRMNGTAQIAAAARADAALNGFTHGVDTVTVAVNNPPSSGYSAADPMAVEVIISKTAGTFFMRTLGFTSSTVKARAVARLPITDSCLVALNPSAASAMTLNGSGVFVRTLCGAAIDSTSSTALTVTAGATLLATSINVVGNYTEDRFSTVAPTPVTGAPSQVDPLSYVQPPPVGGCDHNNFKIVGNKTRTISPGVYCGGMSFDGGANVTLDPGTYVLLGGGLSINGGATLAGSGVTIYNTYNATHSYDGVNINGGGAVNLSAPTSGSLAGVLFFQDRTVTGGAASNFNGGAVLTLTGAVYFPTTLVNYSGGAAAVYTILIADQIGFSGGAEFKSNYAGLTGGTPLRGNAVLSE